MLVVEDAVPQPINAPRQSSHDLKSQSETDVVCDSSNKNK